MSSVESECPKFDSSWGLTGHLQSLPGSKFVGPDKGTLRAHEVRMKKNGNKLFFCSASVVVEAQKVINNVAIGTGFSLYFHYFRKVREDKAGGGGGGAYPREALV